jgi:hypothetical protein
MRLTVNLRCLQVRTLPVGLDEVSWEGGAHLRSLGDTRTFHLFLSHTWAVRVIATTSTRPGALWTVTASVIG